MATTVSQRWYRSSTFLIFVAIVLGVVLGGFFPSDEYPGVFNGFRFLSKAFIALIKGIVVPILVSTIVVGIAQAGDLKAIGRMGGKALLYFEIVTTLALFIGLFVANVLKPGAGLTLRLDAHAELVKPLGGWEIALHTFPSNVFKHAAEGDILPVVVFTTIFGVAMARVGERARPVLAFFEGVAQVMLQYTHVIMALTPLGVFGAMAYNVSHMASGQEIGGEFVKGWPAVFHLLRQYSLLVASLYGALGLLVVLVFVPIMLAFRIPVVAFFRAVREPGITAFSMATSEAALPMLLERMIEFGVPRRVAGFVIPAGYSFNLDGSTLYLVLASMTIAQAAHVPMTFGQQVTMMLTFMLTSKGVAGVPRATLVIIAGTCANFGLPGEAGVAMLLAVDEIMDMGRSLINVVGNGLASVVVAKSEGVFGTIDPTPLEPPTPVAR